MKEQILNNKAHILVVDDEPDMLYLMAGLLRKNRFKVVQARGAKEALTIILEQKNRFDLLITDFMMPEMSGLSFVNTLQELNIFIPYFVVSGFISKQVVDLFREKGCAAFLRKPLDKDYFLEMVTSILNEEFLQNEKIKIFDA